MVDFFKCQGLQQQMQYGPDKDRDGVPDSLDKWPGKNDEKAKKDAIQNVAGVLVGEYYQDKEEFEKNHPLIKEMQDELVRLGYDLGTSGKDKNGVDGAIGAKTIMAIHNFEQDHANEVKAAASIQESIKKGWKK
ncbi:MAG: hypothetical protein KIS77_03810 [Saprospiraceae bacterium]|nr:hypothetical protein [Saprospiraceae bacterium]